MKRVIGLILTMAVMLSLAGCGSGSDSYRDYVETNNAEYESNGDWGMSIAPGYGSYDEKSEIVTDETAPIDPEFSVQDGGNTTSTVENQEKLVYSASVSIEVKYFDDSVSSLKNQVKELGGIVQTERFYDDEPFTAWEGSNYSNKISGYKTFSTTVRIPTEKFTEFLERLNNVGHVKSSSSQVDNITQTYYNTKAYLESYQNQLAALQAMYKDAETIAEMLEIEARIADVQAEITSLTTHIQSMDLDVAYSTVSITIDEVVEYSDTPREYEQLSFLEKIQQRFINSWDNFLYVMENLVYFLIDIIWGLLFIAILIPTLVLIHSKSNKKRGKINHKQKKIEAKGSKNTQNTDTQQTDTPEQ